MKRFALALLTTLVAGGLIALLSTEGDRSVAPLRALERLNAPPSKVSAAEATLAQSQPPGEQAADFEPIAPAALDAPPAAASEPAALRTFGPWQEVEPGVLMTERWVLVRRADGQSEMKKLTMRARPRFDARPGLPIEANAQRAR